MESDEASAAWRRERLLRRVSRGSRWVRPMPLLVSIGLHSLVMIGIISTDTVHELCQLSPTVEVVQIDMEFDEGSAAEARVENKEHAEVEVRREVRKDDDAEKVKQDKADAELKDGVAATVCVNDAEMKADEIMRDEVSEERVGIVEEEMAAEKAAESGLEQPQARVVAPPAPKAAIRPVYPRRARRRGAEGTVLVELNIDASGEVAHAAIVESSGCQDLDAAALSAARDARFTPAQSDGEPIPGVVRLPFKFQLR